MTVIPSRRSGREMFGGFPGKRGSRIEYRVSLINARIEDQMKKKDKITEICDRPARLLLLLLFRLIYISRFFSSL